VVAKNPGNLNYLLELAHLYRTISWFEVALLKYQNVLEKQPANVEGLWGIGATYFLMAENGKAREPSAFYDKSLYFLKSALSFDPANIHALYYMGLVQLTYKNNSTEASKYWKMFLAPGYAGEYAEIVKEKSKGLK
jgi:cytochrome c-type biogenesis protein CcmH/NrfG